MARFGELAVSLWKGIDFIVSAACARADLVH